MQFESAHDGLSFGDWVQQRRLALDLTRPDLARRIHCSPSTIKKIERDERRPSRQMAALLADALRIPPNEHVRFVDIARGELSAERLPKDERASLPPFLHPSQPTDQAEQSTLVAREAELGVLRSHLEKAVAGHGEIVFISGEAGDGKSMLAQAFLRESQAEHADLIAAIGHCNAYTGIGDPYLPFREILESLTGDLTPHWNVATMSRTYGERLWQAAPRTVQALLEAGPDLVGSFLVGASLRAAAAAALPVQDEALLSRLDQLVSRQQTERVAGHRHQEGLFSQYTRVLELLARRQPLLLIIDDLQWADRGSISLLFHLTRRLAHHPILLVGIYRGAEVALGRNGERHPLEPLLNELQRLFGEIHVRLNQTDGRRFVDALLDLEPNHLDEAFRAALYRQTAGHPLFTVELLTGLRARGDIVRGEDGAWLASSTIDWDILPARIEGLLKERIARLTPPLQEVLRVGAVAGEAFAAEIIAGVLGIDVHQLTRQLSTVLSREQRLIVALGRQQINNQTLSQYAFRHILFQQYLYNSQDRIQRAQLHSAIAAALERAYGDAAASIAPQLARHFAIAGKGQRALHYYTLAGNAAAAVYANAEAAAHYRSAIGLLNGSGGDGSGGDALHVPQGALLDLYRRLGRTLELSSHHDEAVAAYEEMEDAAQAQEDQAMELASLLARAAIRATVNFARDPAEGRALLDRARALAAAMDDRAAQAAILWNLLILSAYTGGDLTQRLRYGEDALRLAREVADPEQLAFTLHDIFYAYAGAGQWARAGSALCEARDQWERLDNLPMLSEALMRSHWVELVTGAYDQAIAHAEAAHRVGVESHNLDAQALSHFMLGSIYWEQGRLDQAEMTMVDDIAVAEQVASLTPLTGTRAELGLLRGELGDLAQGLELANLARTVAETKLPILRFWPHAIQVSLELRRGNTDAAAALVEDLTDYREVKERFGYMPFMWIRVGLAHGELALVQGKFDRTVAEMDALYADLAAAGIWHLRPDVLHLKGRALLALGAMRGEEARQALTDAEAAARRLGSRRILWPILTDLAMLAQRDGDAAAASLREEAAGILAAIAAHIKQPAVRAAFIRRGQLSTAGSD